MKPPPRCILGFALALTAAPALAAPNPHALNIARERCWGDGGTSDRLPACNTNSGLEQLDLSLVVDQRIDDVDGVEMPFQFVSERATLPAWWSMLNAQDCRQTSLGLTTQPPGPLSTVCPAWGAVKSMHR